MPAFSVIIPVHNRPRLVRQAIDSVIGQDFADREIIVVDDASTDETREVLRSYGNAIRLVTLEHQSGCEVARNAGAELARGEYLVFLDSDDLLFPWALGTYHLVIIQTGLPALLFSRLVAFSDQLPLVAAGDLIEIVVYKDYLARDRNIRSTASMIVVRRDVFASVRGWRQSTASTFNGSEVDFLFRIGCHGPAVLIERPRVIAYRLHSENSVGDLRRVVWGVMRLIKTERAGLYPGGEGRRAERRGLLGKLTIWCGRSALLEGRLWLALCLLFVGLDMILIRVVNKLKAKSCELVPSLMLRRDDYQPSASRK